MNIALVHNLPGGGAKRNTYEQIKGLKKRGHKIYEYTFSTASLNYLPFNENVESTKVYPLNWLPLKKAAIKGIGPMLHLLVNIYNIYNLAWVSWKVAREIDHTRFDLVYITDCRYLITPLVLLFLHTPSLFYINTILDRAEKNAETFPEPTTNAYQRISRYPIQLHKKLIHNLQVSCLKKASLVLTNSVFTRDEILKNTRVTSEVLYPGVELDIFSPTLEQRKEYVLSVGSLSLQKGHNFIIECAGLLPESKRLKVVIAAVDVNSGYKEELYETAAQYHVDLEIKSAQTSCDMAQIYHGAFFLAFAPRYEPFGLVVIEAMSCGLPVVGINEGGLSEIIVDGVNGYLTTREVGAFSRVMEHLIEDRDQCEALGNQARKYVVNGWSWDEVINKLDVYITNMVLDIKTRHI